MSYREEQRKKAIYIRNAMLKDPGSGVFLGKEREFVLNDPTLNLWEGIREDARRYFKINKIPWWKGNGDNPTGHLLSSQVTCVNHLYYLRQRPDLATVVLQGIDPGIKQAVIVDDGYVEFEFIGEKSYLNEKSWTRGANCTSIDAVMIGENHYGIKKMFLIEWKYTEDYASQSKLINQRSEIYDKFIVSKDSPFKDIKPEAFYYEPFYQMMRQTLLAWKMIENNDHNCKDYIHVHVIPEENKELLERITSPYLSGANITEAWKSVLKEPDKYMTISPEKLMAPCEKGLDSLSFVSYLQKRYWPEKVVLPSNLRGRSIHENVIPTVCNLKNMLEKLIEVNGDYSQLKQWEKRSYKAYNIDEIKHDILHASPEERKELIRNHILNGDPKDFGASCIDIYLVAYVAENYGSGKENFFKYVRDKGISKKENTAQAIWQVGKGDGVYLGVLNEDGSVRDWSFFVKWIKG